MKIFLMSCHSILEADWVKMWTNMGHYVFSPGSYVQPENPGDQSMRPKGAPPDEYLERYQADMAEFDKLGKPGIDNKELLTDAFCDRFDLVVLMHLPKWAHANKEVLAKRQWVWATIGQSISGNEAEMKRYVDRGNMKIVRYSPKERLIPGFIGENAMIRFAKDPAEFSNWNGDQLQVISCAQSMKVRDFACNYSFFNELSQPFPRKLYGPGNEDTGSMWGGKLSFEDLKAVMRDNRAYFCGGTIPASYVLNSIEAWMTGIPLLTIGSERGNGKYFPGHFLQEYTDLIDNGINGLASDKASEHQEFIKLLFDNKEFARKIGEAGRKKAIETFGIETVSRQWAEFFKTYS